MLNDKQLAKIRNVAERAGFDDERLCQILGVKAIVDWRGSLGDALNKLEDARHTRPQSEVVVLPPDQVRRLYKSQELYEIGRAVRAFATWANDDTYPFTDLEIALTVRRGDALGLDVFNPHEVQVWKDRHGVSFQIAYTLMVGWANRILGGHTRPQYVDLTPEEKEAEGIPTSDHACRCTFTMLKDLPLIATMLDAGWEAKEARADLSVVGMATVSAKDWSGKYFAPNARSKRWKLEKRAYTDALRRRFGTPSRSEITELRRLVGTDNVQTADWKVAAGEGHTGDIAVLAAGMSARARDAKEKIAAMTPEEVEGVLVKGREVLHGTTEDADWDALISEPAKPAPMSPEFQATHANAQDVCKAVIAAGLTENEFSYKAIVAKFMDLDLTDKDAMIARFEAYRKARADGLDSDQAAQVANAKCWQLKDGRILSDVDTSEYSAMVDKINAAEEKANSAGLEFSPRILKTRAHILTLAEAAKPVATSSEELRAQWDRLAERAQHLGLDVVAEPTDDTIAAAIDELVVRVAATEDGPLPF